MKPVSINDLNINDSVLLKSVIINDTIEMELDYVTDYSTQAIEKVTLVFSSCTRIAFNNNTGYDCKNSLLSAEESITNSKVKNIIIKTNTTDSVIEIDCKDVYIRD